MHALLDDLVEVVKVDLAELLLRDGHQCGEVQGLVAPVLVLPRHGDHLVLREFPLSQVGHDLPELAVLHGAFRLLPLQGLALVPDQLLEARQDEGGVGLGELEQEGRARVEGLHGAGCKYKGITELIIQRTLQTM